MSILAGDLSRAFDPVLFAIDCGITPDDWQSKLLRQMPKRCLVLASRQIGKTETAILIGLHTAIYEPGSLVLIVSPSQRQSGEVFRRLMLAYAKLKGVPALEQEVSAARAVQQRLSNRRAARQRAHGAGICRRKVDHFGRGGEGR